MRFWILAIGLGVALAGSARAAEEKTLVLRDGDNGKSFTLTDEKVVMILSPGNPTTGYSWKVAGVEGKVLALDGEVVYLKSDPAAPKVGGGGIFAASFRPKAAGKAVVNMEYKRPWEKDKPAARTFSATIEVKNAPATKPAATKPAQ